MRVFLQSFVLPLLAMVFVYIWVWPEMFWLRPNWPILLLRLGALIVMSFGIAQVVQADEKEP